MKKKLALGLALVLACGDTCRMRRKFRGRKG